MRRYMGTFFLLTGLAAVSFGQAPQGEYILPEEHIVETAEPPETEPVPEEVLESGRAVNMGQALDELPGISVVRRAANACEPVIRGLGWERVQTQVNGLPLYGACPARMDPPATFLRPYIVQDAYVVKGIPSVTLGPGGTAGRIMVSTDYDRGPDAGRDFGGWIQGTGDTARRGKAGEFGLYGGTERYDVMAVIEGMNYDDYESGDDILVPARQDEYGGYLSLGARPLDGHRGWFSAIDLEDEGIDYPALPMNSDRTSSRIFSGGYRVDFDEGACERLEFRIGYQTINHLMSNRGKPNRGILHAETPAESDSFSTSLAADFRLWDPAQLTVGVDFSHLDRDALRRRVMVANGMRFRDHIWPDATQWDLGAFAEINVDLAPDWRLCLGGRLDYVESDADAADDPSLGGRTIRDNYVLFYGSDAADVADDDTVGAANVLLEWDATADVTAHVGAGLSSRAAGITERYFAFAPAPGGYQVGDPSLDPEFKYEVDGGVDWSFEYGWLSATVFHAWVDDYIYQTALDYLDVDGDGAEDLLRGFFNVDARLYGGELAAVLRPVEHLSFPMTVSYVRAKNRTDNRDLPEIPPLEGRLAVRVDYGVEVPWWAEFGVRIVDNQDKVDDAFPEDESPGFTVYHLRGGFEVQDRLRVELGVENLFDKEYHEHLTREALLPVGDLAAGDEVPEPGRSLYATVRWMF